MDFEEAIRETVIPGQYKDQPAAIRVWRCNECGATGWIIREDGMPYGGNDDLCTAEQSHEYIGGCAYLPELLDGFE